MTCEQAYGDRLTGDLGVELWGGVECTVNRVGDRYRDQLRLTGHHHRLGDLQLIAALGITALRFPILWERVAPVEGGAPDWTWSDTGLGELDRLGIRPIVGLLHHGSGPPHTSLIADNFVVEFTAYAAAVAARYPQVLDWTPINEPLTTARFSTLYGTWYPHRRDRRAFWLAMINQAEATAGAMAAIRRVQPAARLIQTDDLGTTYADDELDDVAVYYNERRWLFWDLLAGRVGPAHYFWPEVVEEGLVDRVSALAAAPCPPDVLGINHYPTSDRYLSAPAGANPGGERYDDLVALRVMPRAPGGLATALREAWARYGIPLAITESHLGSTREEQVRWVQGSWNTALGLRADGVDVRALTAWALMGNVDWVNLLTLERGHYETGAFDVRSGTRRPTAVARLLASLGGQAPAPLLHAIAGQPGWWQRDVRLHAAAPPGPAGAHGNERSPGSRPILITGATGTLGQAVAGACRLRGLDYVLTDRAALPIEDAGAVARLLDTLEPWAVINAAGFVRVDDAEGAADACMTANAHGAAVLARACAARGIHCTLFSSDLVFGDTDGPHHEGSTTDPLGVYGSSKAAAEVAGLALMSPPLVVRTAAFFSPFDPHNFAMQVERLLRRGGTMRASGEHVVTPTYLPDLVLATLDLVIDGETGLWHLTGEEPVSWLDFGRRIAGALELDPAGVVDAAPATLGWRARRPRNAALVSRRGRLLPSLEEAIATHAAERLLQRG